MRTTTIIAAALLAACAVPATAGADEIEPYYEPEAADWQAGYGDELTTVDQYDAMQQATPNAGALTGDEFRFAGVYQYGGRTEAWYSDSELYHWRTPEWWADGEGFYRDADGNYVVAASDVPMGSALGTSRGQAVVYDTGCACGVTDFYVHGW